MGFISRKLLPACGNACLCCPALTPSSRRPVKRYKKLLAEIFPKNMDSAPNERKIMKLCEYAAKNHARIPKIAKFLEQKCYKELQSEQYHFIKIIMEVYSKLLYICKEQMAYFAGNLLSVIVELLDAKQQDSLRILGCQTLTTFVYGQVDSTYARSIDALVPKIVLLARENGGEHYNLLHVASLQCLSAMVWFMTESSYIFTDLEKIIHATLENYGMDEQSGNDYERRAQHHNWVDEVTGCEIRPGPMKHNDVSLSTTVIRSWPVTKESSILTREESENPKVWSQICIQKLAELAKETTTMRQILDPMFIYFDMGRHWAPHQGLAIYVLSDIAYFSKSTGSEQFILVSLIRHVDHKNVMHDPQLKSNIIQIAACLVKQLRLRSVVIEIGVVSDLCRHLRKSLQAIVETVGPEEASLNTSLQNSIEDCLLEIAKGIGDASPFFDMITLTLEKLPISSNVARATIGSLLIIADVISQTSSVPHSQLIFPDALLLQLLKAMLHPDVEARVGAHLIFWVILAQTPIHPKHDSEFLHKSMKRHSRTMSAFASATALFEKLRRGRGRGYENADKYRHDINDESNIKEMCEDEWRHGGLQRSSPYFNKLSCSMVDRANISTNYLEADVNFIMLTEDQIAQLLSGFWKQAHQPDNMPSNYEAIAHSFSMTILSSHLKNPNQNGITRFFQLPLSLTSASLDPAGVLPPTSQRSLLTLSLGMLAFTGIIFHIPELTDTAKLLISFHVDPYLKICDDLQLHTRPESNIKEYGSEADQEASKSSVAELRLRMVHCGQYLINIIVQRLSRSTNMTENDLIQHLSEAFTPEDVPFGADLFLCWDSIKAPTSEESLSFDEVHSRNSSIDGDGISESPSTDLPKFMPKMVASSMPQFISVGQLLESALHVAGQVAGTVVSTSPLPYGTIASQCESFVMGTRNKLSTWLVSAHDSVAADPLQLPHATNNSANAKLMQVHCTSQEEQVVPEPWRPLRLPPASPFDNFMRAAGC